MIKALIVFSSALALLSGCAGQYSYRITNNELHIFLKNPEAKEVYFLSSLDQFELHEAYKNSKGVWEVTIPYNQEFRYFFLVDGSIYLPACDQKENDDFGSENCVYIPEE